MEKGWAQASDSNLEPGQVKKYGQCSACDKYFWVVLDENGEIIKEVECLESQARIEIDTENGHDYEISINWVELKDAQGNVIGYDRKATKTATLECTREGCVESRTRWDGKKYVYDDNCKTNIALQPLAIGTGDYFVDMKLEGKCTDANGAKANYTVTVVNGDETFVETKTVNVTGHVQSSEYAITSRTATVNGEQKSIPQHIAICMYCGEWMSNPVDCVGTEFVKGSTTSTSHITKCVCGREFVEDHKFVTNTDFAGDFYDDETKYVHHLNSIEECSVCGYQKVSANHVLKSAGFDGHYCVVCDPEKENPAKHACAEWKKVNGVYESTCDICKEKVTTTDFSGLLTKYGPKAGEGDNSNPTLVITLKDDANFSVANEIPEGVKLIVSAGKTMTIKNQFVVKGILEIEDGATCTVDEGKSLKVDKTVDGAEIIGEVEGQGKLIEEVKTQEAFEEALDKANEVVVNCDVEVGRELETLDEEKTVTVNAGSTMKVTGKLADTNLTIEGEGTVKLANENTTDNGANLVNAVKAGAEKVVVSENATASEAVVVDGADEELTVELADGKTIERSENNKVVFNVKNGGNLTISGNGETSIIKNNNNIALQNINGTLTVSDVKVEGTTGVYVGSESSTTTLTNVNIKASNFGFTANASESLTGIGNVTLTNCNIESTGGDGLYLPAKGNVTIDGGTIKGKTAILDKAANLTLKGDLTLIGTDTRNTSNKLSEYMKNGTQGYANGTPLLIVSQKNYSDGKEVTVTIGDDVKFAYEGLDQNHYDVEIVGVDNVDSGSVGAKLSINYTAITDETLETDNTKINPTGITKKYFLDKGNQFKGTISINGQTK